VRWAIFTNHDEGASKRWSLDKAAQFNARTVAKRKRSSHSNEYPSNESSPRTSPTDKTVGSRKKKKKLTLERVPIKRIVTSNEPSRQNSGERTDKCVKWRAERKEGRTLPHHTSSGWDPPNRVAIAPKSRSSYPHHFLHFGAITGQQRCSPRVCDSATNAGSDSRPREGGSSDHSTALWTNNARNPAPKVRTY